MTNLVSDSGSGDGARKPIAVFLLDDHEVVRRGVRALTTNATRPDFCKSTFSFQILAPVV